MPRELLSVIGSLCSNAQLGNYVLQIMRKTHIARKHLCLPRVICKKLKYSIDDSLANSKYSSLFGKNFRRYLIK